MKTVFMVLILATQATWGSFKSSVKGITIPNTHIVAAGDGVVYRGSQPLGKENELLAIGVTDVIIFKNETKNEVQTEIENLKARGINEDRIYHLPFRWKEVQSEKQQCEMIIEAMKIMKEVYEDPERSVFFHCTVGEDRTGMLAGLFTLLFEGEEADNVFEKEMCARGYEAGNPNKPAHVVKSVRDELTPTFVKMASLIKAGKISYENLDSKICKNISKIKGDTSGWRCH